jgi:hypothetical protein
MRNLAFGVAVVTVYCFSSLRAQTPNYPSQMYIPYPIVWYWSAQGAPSDYGTGETVQAHDDSGNVPTTGGSYTWTISGEPTVSFSPTSVVSTQTTTSPSVQIWAIGEGASENGVQISWYWTPPNAACGSPAGASGFLTADYPSYLRYAGEENYGPASTCGSAGSGTLSPPGYSDFIHYTVYSGVYGMPLPVQYPVVEALWNQQPGQANAGYSYPTINPAAGASGGTTPSGTLAASDFYDNLCLGGSVNPPLTSYPATTEILIFTENQRWCLPATSVSAGANGTQTCTGRDIATDTQNYFNDQGTATAIHSPD